MSPSDTGSSGLLPGRDVEWCWREGKVLVTITLLSVSRGRSVGLSISYRGSDALVARCLVCLWSR